jgi:hypothetical protein
MTVDIAGGPHRVLPRHLALVGAVVSAIAEAEGNEEDDEGVPAGPKHRKPDPAGASTTMRALMALGAIAAALGFSSAQQALGDAPAKARASAPDREDEAAPGTSHLTFEDTPKAPVPKAPQNSRPATKPAVHPAGKSSSTTIETVAYTLPKGTGKHRKPAADHGDSRGHELGRSGKHRRHHGPRHERDGEHAHHGRHHSDHDGEHPDSCAL